MSLEEKNPRDLTEEVHSLRQQVAHLRDGNQRAILTMEKRGAELQALNAIGQSTSLETSSTALYQTIHEEIKKLMGEVNFMIALHDAENNQIEIPYAHEQDKLLEIEPLPVGEGLTSIVIRTGQPLMIIEDTVNKARALGAKIAGPAAKSWLGVPLLVAGDIIGAIIVQDLEEEHRFDEDHKRLLNMLAAQIGVAISNVRLIEDIQAQADRERLLFQITSKIRRSVDMKTILKTTVTEIGKAMDVRRATIEIKPQAIRSQHGEDATRTDWNATL